MCWKNGPEQRFSGQSDRSPVERGPARGRLAPSILSPRVTQTLRLPHAAPILFGLLLWGIVTAAADMACGQLKLTEGESVKVFYLNEFRDGVVLRRQGDRYGIEFEFAGGTQQRVFERPAIRMLCEVEALDFSRTWTSGSGQFKVDAALKAIQGDQVVLMKLDLSEITVGISSLSGKDVTYIERLKKTREGAVQRGEVPATVPTLPEVETFSGGFGETGMVAIGGGQMSPLGRLPSYLAAFTQAGCGFNLQRKRQELVAIIPVGGPEQLVLVSVREDNFFNRGVPFPSQLYWVSLKQQKVVGTAFVTPESYGLDYDPCSRTLVTYKPDGRGGLGDQGSLTAWRLSPGDSKAEPLVQWRAKLDRKQWSYHAKVINERVIMAKTDRQTYTAWDIVDKRELYSIKCRSFFDAQAVLTPDRQHLLLPEDGYVTVLEAATGQLVFQLKAPSSVAGVNVNEAGTRLAALTSNRIYVWELDGQDERPISYNAPLVGNPFSARVNWLDDDHLLIEGFGSQILFRLSLELPVWSYQMDLWQRFLNDDPLRSLLLNGHFFYTAEPDRFGGTLAVGAVKMPGPAVAEVTNKIVKEDLYLVKPGTPVAVGKMQVSDPDRVRQWIEQKIQSNGWTLANHADVIIDCEMGQLPPRTETYSSMSGRGGETNVTYAPYFANLRIRQGNKVLWQGGSSTGAPPVVSGGDIQGQVNRLQVPQLQFFEAVAIPDRILDPKFGNGFGQSELGLRGIVVVSTSPVGRADNPEEAQRNSADNIQKARDQTGQTQDEGLGFGPRGDGGTP